MDFNALSGSVRLNTTLKSPLKPLTGYMCNARDWKRTERAPSSVEQPFSNLRSPQTFQVVPGKLNLNDYQIIRPTSLTLGYNHRTSRAVVLMGCPTAAVSSTGYVISDLSSKFGSDMVAYVIISYDIGGWGVGGGRTGVYCCCAKAIAHGKTKKLGRELGAPWLGQVWSGLPYSNPAARETS